MFFITYSQNILFLVLAICALCLTIFISLLLYHLIIAAREIEATASMAKRQVEEISGFISKIKNSLGIGLTVVSVIKEAASSAQDFFASYAGKKSSKKAHDN